MITIDAIQHASPAVREKAKRTWIKKLTPTQFKVVPKARSKSKRIVMFLPTNQVLCVSRDTGEICQANYFGMVCHHVYRAAVHLTKLGKGKEMTKTDEPFTREEARRHAFRLIKRFPNSPISTQYNAGQWWVVFGVDSLGSAKRVRQYERQLAKTKRR